MSTQPGFIRVRMVVSRGLRSFWRKVTRRTHGRLELNQIPRGLSARYCEAAQIPTFRGIPT
jgi:hypothetical protein